MKYSWGNINNLMDKEISYLLFLEEKTIKQISIIRNIDEEKVKMHIFECKKDNKFNILIINTFIEEYLTWSKDKRIEYLSKFDNKNRIDFISEIKNFLNESHNIDDLIIIIWTIGELKIIDFNNELKYFSAHPHGNIRRITFSAMGKIKDRIFLPYLIQGMKDSKPQIRQYAIISFGKIADKDLIDKLNIIKNNNNELEYVKNAAIQAEKNILDNNN